MSGGIDHHCVLSWEDVAELVEASSIGLSTVHNFFSLNKLNRDVSSASGAELFFSHVLYLILKGKSIELEVEALLPEKIFDCLVSQTPQFDFKEVRTEGVGALGGRLHSKLEVSTMLNRDQIESVVRRVGLADHPALFIEEGHRHTPKIKII